ncbi:hypothetical protein ACHAW6_014937 [Cyclotella cf. meneghiniana]
MLLRITQVSGGNTENHPISSTEPPLHACLATAATSAENNEAQSSSQSATQAASAASIAPERHETSGQIFTVGRKNCTVTLDDKCVSRRHASIRLLSDRRHDLSQSTLSQSIAGVVEFGRPESKEEIAACATSKTGVICVVRDCGSKFGTFVSVQPDLTKFLKDADEGRTYSNGDGDETGDETDDDAGEVKPINFVDLTEKQSRAARMLDDSNDPNASLPHFQKVEANSSTILLPLSHYTDKQNAHVTILFGPQGSGIRLLLLPLQFTFSRFSAKDQDRLLTRLHTIGATHSPQWDVFTSTHLVTKEAKATAKHIMAWACCKPAVTDDYVLALLTRTNARDAMPNEEDYAPPGNSQLSDKLDRPCMALRGYRIAVLVEDDSAPLALSAGADVVLVYENAPTEEREFESWWEEQCLRAANEKKALVVMETSSRKASLWMKWLTGLRGRFTNQKNLAKAITTKEDNVLLVDVKKEPIEKLVGWDEEKEDMVVEWGEGLDEELEDEGFDAVAQDDDDATENEDEHKKETEMMPVSTRHSKRRQEVAQEVSVEQGKKKAADEEPRARAKRLKESDNNNPILPSEAKNVGDNQSNDTSGDEQAFSTNNRTKSKTVTKSTNTIINEDESCDESLPDERIPLPITEDGWFVAAPAARKKHRKRIDIDEADGEEKRPKSAAKTARVSGLIVREYVPPPPRIASRRNGNKKDFKRFRKNQVIRGFTSFSNKKTVPDRSIPTIRMVSVLPKESERQRQLEMQQQELDRDQAFADALFNDGGGGRGGGRGHSGGSIAGMFSQSTMKRGRGRR